ncbi:hypothetical protein M6B38_254300 [Iris pallida]|uniref:Uncharacterized protein n=1 Tax=Iris pallida TaxID=29817 RepID=A0AAX6IGX2_IRIPA|nr:hypothetical protein M6B38_254300 [Iris pallida]
MNESTKRSRERGKEKVSERERDRGREVYQSFYRWRQALKVARKAALVSWTRRRLLCKADGEIQTVALEVTDARIGDPDAGGAQDQPDLVEARVLAWRRGSVHWHDGQNSSTTRSRGFTRLEELVENSTMASGGVYVRDEASTEMGGCNGVG